MVASKDANVCPSMCVHLLVHCGHCAHTVKARHETCLAFSATLWRRVIRECRARLATTGRSLAESLRAGLSLLGCLSHAFHIEVVAELAQGFEGCVQQTKLMVKAAAMAGADAAKFQLIFADELSTPDYDILPAAIIESG